MEPGDVFSTKAKKYAKYRWRYAPLAIRTIFDVTRITAEWRVADIGAGTGILTREFAGKVRQVVAVEPNADMRRIARRELEPYPECQVLAGRAEAIPLADHHFDLICVAQALHWFEPQAARQELLRIVKPGGWLAILRNYGTDRELNEALAKIYPAGNDTAALMVGRSQPSSFYFRGSDYVKQDFPFTLQAGWEEFIGALSTASNAPDEGSPLYTDFERGARRAFEEFSSAQQIELHGATELVLGKFRGG